jgi:hypothetical protein
MCPSEHGHTEYKLTENLEVPVMGHTVTFCCRSRKLCFVNYEKIEEKRNHLMSVLENYLNENACVPEAPQCADEVNPEVDALAQYYITMLRSEITGHRGSKIESLASMCAISAIFGQMWSRLSDAIQKNTEVASHEFSKALPTTQDRTNFINIDIIKLLTRQFNEKHSAV